MQQSYIEKKKDMFMLKKLNKKTFINALIIFITMLIAFLSIILSIYSNDEGVCNNDVQNMLINKTQQYVENQKILIVGLFDASSRSAFMVMGDKQGIESYTDRIRESSIEYNSFEKSMENYDLNIISKKNTCVEKSKNVTIINSAMIFFSIISVTLSILYLKKY